MGRAPVVTGPAPSTRLQLTDAQPMANVLAVINCRRLVKRLALNIQPNQQIAATNLNIVSTCLFVEAFAGLIWTINVELTLRPPFLQSCFDGILNVSHLGGREHVKTNSVVAR